MLLVYVWSGTVIVGKYHFRGLETSAQLRLLTKITFSFLSWPFIGDNRRKRISSSPIIRIGARGDCRFRAGVELKRTTFSSTWMPLFNLLVECSVSTPRTAPSQHVISL